MTINSCLCCHHILLRHIRHGGLYWYCAHCRQDMPNETVQSVSTVPRKLEKALRAPVTVLSIRGIMTS